MNGKAHRIGHLSKIFTVALPLLIAANSFAGSDHRNFDWDRTSRWAIQNRGRVKPIDTFARETAFFVTGKSHWDGKTATELVFSWLLDFPAWQETPFIQVAYRPLKEKLALNLDDKYFSPHVLRENAALPELIRGVSEKQQRQERLEELEKKVVELENQLGLLQALSSGEAWTLLPNQNASDGPWIPLSALTHREESHGLPYPKEHLETLRGEFAHLSEAFARSSPEAWSTATGKIEAVLRTSPHYPAESALKREIHYNHLRPFRFAWILYLLGVIILIVSRAWSVAGIRAAGLFTLVGGFVLHAYGFALRVLISGRPPVTNMYESVIWVTWGAMLFAFLIGLAYRKWIIPASAAVFSTVGLILADWLPNVLDPAIHPLEPVLRSNFWLTIHVLTITLSYAAFAVSLCLGNVILGNYAFRKIESKWIQQLTLYMYRSTQIGVVLLAAGTILGGVWADYSWGRFWGWDPKEVWALIALLLYIAVLHGRFAGWLKSFGFVVGNVLAFLGVLMAWYGVNFVLGVGLHSYGFGTGGTGWVASFVVAQIALIVAGYWNYRSASEKGTLDTSIFPKKR